MWNRGFALFFFLSLFLDTTCICNDSENFSKEDLAIIINFLYLFHQRMEYIDLFWKRWNMHCKVYFNAGKLVLSRMRNPSKHRGVKVAEFEELISVTFLNKCVSVFDKYDDYLNFVVDSHPLSPLANDIFLQLRNELRSIDKSFPENMRSIIKKIGSLSVPFSEVKGSLLSFFSMIIKNFFSQRPIMYQLYINIDRMFCELHEKATSALLSFYEEYALFWRSAIQYRIKKSEELYQKYLSKYRKKYGVFPPKIEIITGELLYLDEVVPEI